MAWGFDRVPCVQRQTPGGDELAGAVEANHTRVGSARFTLGNEDVAVGTKAHIGRNVEPRLCRICITGADDALCTERQQDLALRAEFGDGVVARVDQPDVVA